MVNNNQRIGSKSNAHVGRAFERLAHRYFNDMRVGLDFRYNVPIGLSSKKDHEFDPGSDRPAILVECKSHKWTTGQNMPSAKISVWNEAMYYFFLAPNKYRKILFVLRDFSEKHGESLAEYYVRNHGHLIPDDVEILEYDERKASAIKVHPKP